MMLRHAGAAASLVRCARQISTPASSRFMAVRYALSAVPQPAPTIRAQTRLNSSKAGSAPLTLSDILTPPWQVNDLPPEAREAYKIHGPNFFEHLPPEKQDKVMRNIKHRQAYAARLEKEVGSLWYPALKEDNRRHEAEQHAFNEKWAAKKAELDSMVKALLTERDEWVAQMRIHKAPAQSIIRLAKIAKEMAHE